MAQIIKRQDRRGVVQVFDQPRYLARALREGRDARRDLATCGACHRTWDDGISTAWTPTPAARCPYEHTHR